jgi:hypothetical protein
MFSNDAAIAARVTLTDAKFKALEAGPGFYPARTRGGHMLANIEVTMDPRRNVQAYVHLTDAGRICLSGHLPWGLAE